MFDIAAVRAIIVFSLLTRKGCFMEWLTININPPELDVIFVARKDVGLGIGGYCNFIFPSESCDRDKIAATLARCGYLEWCKLPK